MSYYKFTCSNGFCGCNEEFYYEVEDDVNIDEFAIGVLQNDYSFYEPDGRFLAHAEGFWSDTDYEEYEEDYDEYMENIDVYYEEITKEEYEENRG